MILNVLLTSQSSRRIGHHSGQGPFYPVENQTGVEESAAGTDSQEKENELPPEEKRINWTGEDYRDVLKDFYTSQLNANNGSIVQTYTLWRNLISNEIHRHNNAQNKLSSVCRDISRNKRLTDVEISQIRKQKSDGRPHESNNNANKIDNRRTEPSVRSVHYNEEAVERIER